MLAAADPAQPYGAALPWPKRAGARAARVAGAHVVLLGGEAVLYVERGGRSLVPLREPGRGVAAAALAALVAHVQGGGAKRLAVERFDGEPVTETTVMPLLVEAGFLAGPAPRRAARLGESAPSLMSVCGRVATDAGPSTGRDARMTTLEIDVFSRWDAVELLGRLSCYHSHLVQLDVPGECWLVRARTPASTARESWARWR